jgi:hypothetical protein
MGKGSPNFRTTLWAMKDKFTKMARDFVKAIPTEKLIADFD